MLPYILPHIITIILLQHSLFHISRTARTIQYHISSERECIKKRIYDRQTANILEPALAIDISRGMRELLNSAQHPDAEILMIALRTVGPTEFAPLLDKITGAERNNFLTGRVHFAYFGSPLADAIYDANIPIEIIELLLKAGANPNTPVSRGRPLGLLIDNAFTMRPNVDTWPRRSCSDALKILDLLIAWGARLDNIVRDKLYIKTKLTRDVLEWRECRRQFRRRICQIAEWLKANSRQALPYSLPPYQRVSQTVQAVTAATSCQSSSAQAEIAGMAAHAVPAIAGSSSGLAHVWAQRYR